MIGKQLTGTEQMWTYYLQTWTYAYNSFANPVLTFYWHINSLDQSSVLPVFFIMSSVVLFLILQNLPVPRVCNSSYACVLPY